MTKEALKAVAEAAAVKVYDTGEVINTLPSLSGAMNWFVTNAYTPKPDDTVAAVCAEYLAFVRRPDCGG